MVQIQGVANEAAQLFEANRTKLLVLTHDPIGEVMAGPGIRAVQTAIELTRSGFQVLLVSTASVSGDPGFPARFIDSRDKWNIRKALDWADVIYTQALGFEQLKQLNWTSKPVVVDAYAPLVLESEARNKEFSALLRFLLNRDAKRIESTILAQSDAIICANKQQRDYYQSEISTVGFASTQKPIVVVPFGIAKEPPLHTRGVLKGVVPGIAQDDELVIWSGGLYDWFDIETLVFAFSILAQSRPKAKLYFQGGGHPNRSIPEMPASVRAKQLASSLGLLGKNIFFNSHWVPYEERANYLLEADIGVTTHFDSPETKMSFRTRMLDYLWADLPVVSTEGDTFADIIQLYEIGEVVPYQDPQALADAISTLLNEVGADNDFKERIRRVRENYFWSEVLRPLKDLVIGIAGRPTVKRNFLNNASRLLNRPLEGALKFFSRVLAVFETQDLRTILSKLISKVGLSFHV